MGESVLFLGNGQSRLQRIKAEWYEYKTEKIAVTSNTDFYNNAKGYIGGSTTSSSPNSNGLYPFNEDIVYSLFYNLYIGSFDNLAAWGWNGGTYVDHIPEKYLYYLFHTNNISAYDPYGKKTNRGGLDSNDLYDYIMNYNKSARKGYLPIKDGTISADLFADTVDEGRTRGYNVRDFDADIDIFDMLSYSANNPSYWDKWINFGFWKTVFGHLPDLDDSYSDVPPIYAVKDSDLQGSDSAVSKRLLIRQEDLAEFRAYRTSAKSKNQTVFLFRFATTDYFSGAAELYEPRKFLWIFDASKTYKGQAYLAEETCFFDFDIIQLTFNKDGIYHVIPVVSSPIDIVNAITAPILFPDENGGRGGGKYLLLILALLILLVLFAPLLPTIISFLISIIKGIFKIIALPFKAIAKAAGKNKEPKSQKIK